MGEYDYVPGILRELGVRLLITKLRIKPGKPFVFGLKTIDSPAPRSVFVFGLPGNPVSAFVCTALLAGRLIRRWQGKSPEEDWVDATLAMDLPVNGPREFYQPIQLAQGRANALHWKGSADIFTLAHANAVLRREENAPAIAAGQRIRVMPII